MGDFIQCLPVTLRFEGGKVDDPHDPGGRTNEGVTQRVYDAYRVKTGAERRDVYELQPAERDAIYKEGYWTPIVGDALPSGVDLAAFDYGVNSGVTKARQALLASVKLTPVERVKSICAHRNAFLHALKNWARYGKGWGARVAQVEALGIRWASGPLAKSELTKAAAQAKTKANTHTSGAAGSVIIGTASAQHPDPWIAVTIAGVAIVGLLIFVFIAVRQNQRADILSAHAGAA